MSNSPKEHLISADDDQPTPRSNFLVIYLSLTSQFIRATPIFGESIPDPRYWKMRSNYPMNNLLLIRDLEQIIFNHPLSVSEAAVAIADRKKMEFPRQSVPLPSSVRNLILNNQEGQVNETKLNYKEPSAPSVRSLSLYFFFYFWATPPEPPLYYKSRRAIKSVRRTHRHFLRSITEGHKLSDTYRPLH